MRGNFGALFMTFPSLFTSESQFDKIHPVFLLVLKYSESGLLKGRTWCVSKNFKGKNNVDIYSKFFSVLQNILSNW